MFRASTDGGQTFGDKTNLSNSSDAESQNAEIVSAGNDNSASFMVGNQSSYRVK